MPFVSVSPQVSADVYKGSGGGRWGCAPRCPVALSRGSISKKIKNFPPVYGHLNALQLSISVHQRCSVTFKMHQIYLRLGLRPTARWKLPTIPDWLGPRARRGSRMNVCTGHHRPRATTVQGQWVWSNADDEGEPGGWGS